LNLENTKLELLVPSEFIIKLIRYGLVGLTGVLVDFSVTYVFKEYAKFSKYVANSIGFCTAVVTNYLLNRYWTFGAGTEDVFIQFGTFVIVSLIGLVINNFIIYLLSEKWKINFYISKVVAIFVVVFWNFFVNYYYTFRSAA
jgi:putative flippase GtrA